MKDMEKRTITRLREGGKSYAEIAENLHLSVNTVKSFCLRGGVKTLQALRKEADPSRCMQCHKPIEQQTGHKRKRFCSDRCRLQWWNQHRAQMNRKSCAEKTCAHCGNAFVSYPHEERKYCSHACYIQARFGGGRHVAGTR
ncbi:MAG: RNA polymerase subunit sigma-70 [Eubacteriales bacterium]|nr:RNA polymerase subunit sigma-70 [Eubacteriales bacterium]